MRLVTFYADGRSVCTVARPPFECNWDAGPGLREHVVRAVATLADGGKLVATSRTLSAGYVETVEVEIVQVTATVTDDEGRFVKGLARDQFRVKEDDVPQRLTAFAGENIPLEIVVAVDVSHSMTEAMPTLKAAVRTFLTALRPADQVTLMAFNDNIVTLARRATDPALRLRAVDRLAPWGGTALYDAMLIALNTVGKQPGRRSLVVFSDGEDQNSVATLKRVETRLETSDATIYTIGLGRSVKDRDLAQVMARMSQMSGGRSFLLDDIERNQERLRRHRRRALEPVPAVVCFVQRRARRHLAQDPGRAARAEVPGPAPAGLPGGRREEEEAMTTRTFVGLTSVWMLAAIDASRATARDAARHSPPSARPPSSSRSTRPSSPIAASRLPT